ncbi:MAG: hypothetical protein WAS07_05330 [Micropruina sp.]
MSTSTTPLSERPESTQPECNLIMKGGITSGVIYPRLASRLAQEYRLRSIGGSSAGAIAAAAAAVAELRRVRDGSAAGFDQLDRLPDLLNEKVEGRSRLLSLFQPAASAKPLFGVLMAVLDAQQKAKREAQARPSGDQQKTKASLTALIFAAVWALLAGYPLLALLGAIPGLALVLWSAALGGQALAVGLIGGLTLILVGVVIALVIGVKRTLVVDVQANNFGLCTGAGGTTTAPALTDWLHTFLQGAANQGAPVTFGDLDAHGIDLRMMTTNLTQGRPMAMPWTEGGFFFRPEIWRTLFPEEVVTWLVDHPPALPAEPSDAAKYQELLAKAKAEGLAPLPDPGHLPIVVGVRMSLSFPLLISAIPLSAFDWSPKQNTFRTNWFTDGGLCANLPVHFFDRPLASRPTFAIDLEQSSAAIPTPEAGTYLPQGNNEGLLRRWSTWTTHDTGGWAAFIGSMVGTWQGWVDNEALRMPGYRDRVVTVYSTADEGGLNLNMDDKTVRALADRGAFAATRLVTKFTGPFGAAPNTGLDNHRWIRLRVALAGLSDWLDAFAADYQAPAAALPYKELVSATADQLPSYANGSLVAIKRLAEELNTLASTPTQSITAGAPNPRGRLRITPDR